MYQFNYQLTEKDYYEYQMVDNFSLPANKKRHNIHCALVAILLLFLGVICSLNPALAVGSYIFILSGVVWLLLYPKIVQRDIKKNMKQQIANGKILFGKDILLTFDENNIIRKTEERESKALYSAVVHVIEGDEAFYLFINALQAYVIPFRVFASEEQKREFFSFIKAKTSTDD